MASKTSLKNKRVLITSGPTWVAIDDVRVISNKSTGRLGQLLAKHCLKDGAKVTLIEGPVTKPADEKKIRTIKFCYYEEFYKILKSELKKSYDVVIHAAAVSDYKLKNPFKKKISSRLKKLSLQLIPTEKIISVIKKINPKAFLVGFKLESTVTRSNIKKLTSDLFAKAHCDLVVANSSKNNKYCGFIVDKKLNIAAQANSRKEMSKKLCVSLRLYSSPQQGEAG